MVRAFVSGESLDGLADELSGDLLPQMIAAVDEGVGILATEIRRNLSASAGTGKAYRGKRKGQRAAESGSAPVNQTGGLLGSVKEQGAKRKGSRVEGYVAIRFPGAGMLEFGGTDKKGRYHPPHPYARPADVTAQPKIYEAIDTKLGVAP